MSLLLEALKKAELAKQGKQPAESAVPPAQMELEPNEPGSARASARAPQDVITRGELPDISQPLEILSEDLPSASAGRTPDRPEGDPTQSPRSAFAPHQARDLQLEPDGEPSLSTAAGAPPDAGIAADRDAARQLFEVKEVSYNPRRNFYITLGVLFAAGACYGGYVWWQMRPRSTFNSAAMQTASKTASAVPSTTQPTAARQQVQSRIAAAAPQAVPPAPGEHAAVSETAARPTSAAAKEEARPAAAAAPAQVSATSRSASRANPAVRPERRPATRTASRPPARGPKPIAIKAPVLAVDPYVQRGFGDYQRGDLQGAMDSYHLALKRNPLNRDALLGLAAIDLREGRFESAEGHYLRLLELDPRDVDAASGLIALRGQVDPTQSESRLKTLIATNPDAATLYFALGNLYAQQSRWPEAQAAYFKAYAGDSKNPDFAVNLAISLDQLHKKALALKYYNRAVALAANSPFSFNLKQIRGRVRELERP